MKRYTLTLITEMCDSWEYRSKWYLSRTLWLRTVQNYILCVSVIHKYTAQICRGMSHIGVLTLYHTREYETTEQALWYGIRWCQNKSLKYHDVEDTKYRKRKNSNFSAPYVIINLSEFPGTLYNEQETNEFIDIYQLFVCDSAADLSSIRE